jgi:putative ABC transport system ATP-binding protein
MHSAAFIQILELQRHFQMGSETVRALDGISLEVGRGEFVGIAGASGSGKSTLLYLLGGLDHPTGGSIWVEGEDIASLDEDGLAAFRQHKVGFIFQMFNLVPSMTALENVEFPMLFSSITPAQRRQRASQALEMVGLSDRQKHRPSELSGGQQQRVAIARSLVNDPAILLADEPTGNLDSRAGADVMAILKELHDQGRTLITVSHDSTIISQADRSVYLRDGRIIAHQE